MSSACSMRGARTVLFPFVQNEQEAERAVRAARYMPDGHRGIAAMSRASRFGTTADFVTGANKTIGVIVQLETAEALTRLEAIAAVPGIDALFIGPADLSASMGPCRPVAAPRGDRGDDRCGAPRQGGRHADRQPRRHAGSGGQVRGHGLRLHGRRLGSRASDAEGRRRCSPPCAHEALAKAFRLSQRAAATADAARRATRRARADAGSTCTRPGIFRRRPFRHRPCRR